MGIMVYSLLRVMQDLYHQPQGFCRPGFRVYGWCRVLSLGFKGLGFRSGLGF